MSWCYAMTHKLTPKGQLIDLRMVEAGRGGLLEYVHRRRSEGTPWRSVAAEVEEVAGLRVTETGLRYWLAKAGVEDPAVREVAA